MINKMNKFDKHKTHYIVKEKDGKQYDEDDNVICVWNNIENWWEPLPQYEYDTVDYTKLL